MAPSGLAGLLSEASPDLILSCHIADVPAIDVDLKLSAGLAAARLAFAAATDLLGNTVRAKADAWAPALAVEPAKSSGGCPLGFTGITKYKQYPEVQVPSTWSLLAPQQLLWLFLKNTGIVFLLQTNMWLYQALEAEEQALQQGTQAQLPPYPDVLQQLIKACWNSWRELLTRLTRSEIKHWIKRNTSSRTAWKILKDPRESLTSKATFYINTSSWQLVPMYTTTMFRTQLPTYAAELIVACAYDALEELQRVIKLPQKQLQLQQQQPGVLSQLQQLPQQTLQQLQQILSGQASIDWVQLSPGSKRWGLKAAKHLLRVSSTAICAAAGAGVAGALAPRESAGVWAFRGLIVSDLLFANLFMVLLDAGLSTAFGHGPDAGAAPRPQHHLPQHPTNDMMMLFNDLAH